MLLHLLILGMVSGAGTGAKDSVAQFTAVLQPDVTAPSTVSGANGIATIDVSGDGITYDVGIAALKHVSNIAIIDAGRAVELYTVGDSRGNALHITGTLSAGQVDEEGDVPLTTLLQDMREGQAQVVVFTLDEPGGVVTGDLKLQRVAPQAPVVAQPLIS